MSLQGIGGAPLLAFIPPTRPTIPAAASTAEIEMQDEIRRAYQGRWGHPNRRKTVELDAAEIRRLAKKSAKP